MPNAVAYYYKSDGTKVDWFDLDKAICHRFEIPFDEKQWAMGWYNTIALLGALGKSGPEIVDILGPDNKLYHIAAWMSDNYLTEAWYEHER